MKRIYKQWDNFEITKREIVASISIVAIMLLVGILITGKISEYEMDKNEKYNKAIKITEKDLFQYGIDTSVGNAFVYGELKAVDSVTYEGIGGEYLNIKKETERYTSHTRRVAHKSGKTTYYTTETYWTWDIINTESKRSKKIEFCGIELNTSQFELPSDSYITTIDAGINLRDKYYGYPVESKGTIFAYLNKDNNLGEDKVEFYKDKDIDQTLDDVTCDYNTPIFWVVWIVIIIVSVYGFYYLDNRWINK